MLKKIVTWAVIIFIGFFVFTNPHGAGAAVAMPIHVMKNAGNTLATFINSL